MAEQFYHNPKIPDDLSDAREGHLKSFVQGGLKALAALVIFLVLMELAARLLAPLVPFAWERRLTPDFLVGSGPASAQARAVEGRLNALAARLAAQMDLPPEISLKVHYQENEEINALATFGGQIIVFKGLLAELDSEDTLAAVLAHEIGHVKHRDLIKGLVRVVSLSLIFSAVESSAPGGLGREAGTLGLLTYSRRQEEAADGAATLALGRLYGHTKGMELCFQVLRRAAEKAAPGLEIASTHPELTKRLAASRRLAAQYGYPTEGPPTPLNPGLVLRPEKSVLPDG